MTCACVCVLILYLFFPFYERISALSPARWLSFREMQLKHTHTCNSLSVSVKNSKCSATACSSGWKRRVCVASIARANTRSWEQIGLKIIRQRIRRMGKRTHRPYLECEDLCYYVVTILSSEIRPLNDNIARIRAARIKVIAFAIPRFSRFAIIEGVAWRNMCVCVSNKR